MSRSLVTKPSVEARERILRAAEKLFAEKGYAATSVQEITVGAEVNKALLYYYFEDKHDLYACLIDDGTREFRQVVDGALNGAGTCAERLRRLVHDHVDLMWRRSDLLRMVHRCLMAGDQEEFQLVEKFQQTLAPLEQFFADAAATGEFRPVDPKMAARSVIGLDTGFAFCRIYQEQPFTQQEVANHVADLLLGGLSAA